MVEGILIVLAFILGHIKSNGITINIYKGPKIDNEEDSKNSYEEMLPDEVKDYYDSKKGLL